MWTYQTQAPLKGPKSLRFILWFDCLLQCENKETAVRFAFCFMLKEPQALQYKPTKNLLWCEQQEVWDLINANTIKRAGSTYNMNTKSTEVIFQRLLLSLLVNWFWFVQKEQYVKTPSGCIQAYFVWCSPNNFLGSLDFFGRYEHAITLWCTPNKQTLVCYKSRSRVYW